MKRKFLEDLGIEKENIDKIMAENGADIEAEKAKTTEANTKLTNTETQLKEANKTIETLKKNNGDNGELQKKITEYEKQMKEQKAKYDAEITKLNREAINTELLSKYKAKNNKAVMAVIGDIEAPDNDSYKLLLESKIKAASEAEDSKFLFGEVKVDTHYNPEGGGTLGGKNPWAKESFNLTEQGKLIKSNPAQAKELASVAGYTLNI